MIPAARISAATEILADVETRRRPAADAMKDWGLGHRFAGSGDRAAIAGLLYDALRRKSSSGWLLGEATPRAEVLGSLKQLRGLGVDEIAALFTGEGHAPSPLTDAERERLANADLSDAPAYVRGDYPEWLAPAFAESFGDDAAAAGQALAERAPVDLRVNALKSNREKALSALAHLDAVATPLSPLGIRIAVRPDGRGPALSAEPAYIKGLVEVQDEGSQLAALLSNAKPGIQALDLCAGAGGKTLALAGMMGNQGQIYATDTDGRRLAPIFGRLERSGARNVQVRAPRGAQDILSDLLGRCDLVFVDAPCSGSGRLASQPRREMAHAPRCARAARQGSDRDAGDGGALRQAGRPHPLCHLFGAEGGERGSHFRLPRVAREFPSDRRRPTREVRWASGAGRARFDFGRGPAHEPACHRDRRLLCRGSDARGLIPSQRRFAWRGAYMLGVAAPEIYHDQSARPSRERHPRRAPAPSREGA